MPAHRPPATPDRTTSAAEQVAPPRPPHHHLGMVVLVAVGGVAGTIGRDVTTRWLTTTDDGLPVATLTVNLAGCFLLGLLLEALGRRGPETPRMRGMRLALGTGVLGGFTTFSSLAEELALLVHDHGDVVAVVYAAVSVIGGLVAAVLGIALAAGHHRLTSADLPEDPDAEEEPAVPDRDDRAADTETRGEQR